MSKTSDVLYLAISALLFIKSSIARPFRQEEFRNAILKNSEESRWLDEIFDNETDFEFESNQPSVHFPSNRDLVKSVSEDYEEYEYYYTYEEDPIIEIRFRRNVEEATSLGSAENDIVRSTTAGSPLSLSPSNAFPKPLNARRNRRLKKNLRRNRRLRKTLKREKKFLSNRT